MLRQTKVFKVLRKQRGRSRLLMYDNRKIFNKIKKRYRIMIKNLLLLGLLLGLLARTIQASTSFSYASSTPYCAAPGELTLGIEDQSNGGTVIDFDSIGTYYNSDKESIPVMVKKGDETINFKFYSYQNDLQDTGAIECTGTTTFKYIELVGSYLFLNDTATPKLVVCAFDPAVTTISAVTLITTDLVPNKISLFNPYLVDGSMIYVLVGDGTSSQVVSFDSTTGASSKIGNPIGYNLLSAMGNDVFLYDEAAKKFLSYAASAWTYESAIGSVDGKELKVYGLREKNVIINVMTTNKLDSVLYKLNGNSATKVTEITGSTFIVMDFTDGVNDYVHVNSDRMLWLTLPSAGGSIFTSTVTSSQNSNLGNILNVALSGNKAVILYSAGRLEYWKHKAANQIEVLFSRSYSSGQLTGSNKQFKLSITCMCAGVDRFACFSATLNCVIIRKAGVKCHQGVDQNAATW